MTVWLSGLINVVLVAVELCIYLILADVFLLPKRTGALKGAMLGGFFVLNYLVTQLCPNAFLRQGIMLLMFFLLTTLLYQTSIVSSIFLALAYLAIMNISDVAVLYGAVAITGDGLEALLQQPYVSCIVSYSAKFLELFIVVVIHVWGSSYFRQTGTRVLNYIRFSLFPLFTLLSALLMYLAAVKAPQIAPFLLFCVIFLLISDLSSVVLFGKFEHQQES